MSRPGYVPCMFGQRDSRGLRAASLTIAITGTNAHGAPRPNTFSGSATGSSSQVPYPTAGSSTPAATFYYTTVGCCGCPFPTLTNPGFYNPLVLVAATGTGSITGVTGTGTSSGLAFWRSQIDPSTGRCQVGFQLSAEVEQDSIIVSSNVIDSPWIDLADLLGSHTFTDTTAPSSADTMSTTYTLVLS